MSYIRDLDYCMKNTIGLNHFSNEHMKINTDRIDDSDDFMMYIRLTESTEFAIGKKVDYA